MLEIDKVSHFFGKTNVLCEISLKVEAGQFVALVGPSGCGKSTLLRLILGTDKQSMGEIRLNGQEISGLGKEIGIVYQKYSLFPFLTALDNVAFGLKLSEKEDLPYRWLKPKKWHKLRKDNLEQARNLLKEVGLSCFDVYPGQLSGGMQQRVAIAQALIMRPKILLMDEPFGALDESMREDLQEMLLGLYGDNLVAKSKGEGPPHTVIFVTHELNEAFYLSDRVVGLKKSLDAGATVCYDELAPVFKPGEPRDYGRFADLKQLLRKTVFGK